MTSFELLFSPSVSLISVVRRFVSNFYEKVLDDADAVSRVALATHELLENAVKYSVDGATTLSITVEAEPEGRLVSIRLRNRAAEKDVAALREIFREMGAHADATAYYQLVMERGAKSKTGSGLGIPRVRAEGEMSMSYTIENGTACIVAQTRVPSRRSA